MAASNKEVVNAFQIFEKRLILYIFYEKPEEKMVVNTVHYYLTKSPFFFVTYY